MENAKQRLKMLSLLFLLSLTGCAKYDSRSLPKMEGEEYTVDNIQVSKKILTEHEVREIFGRDSSTEFNKKGIQPVILNIKNKTDKKYIFKSDDIDLKMKNPDAVAKMLHKKTSLRVVGWSILGLFVWPCFIGAAIDGVSSKNYNKDLDKDMATKALYPHEIIKIRPNEKISKIIFVAKDNFVSKLNLRLVESLNKSQQVKFII
ncbi:hypothetical protein GF322_02500 [Candidatus Dependentiae bacterium]|nr:hypothetical protein [Candidatus Dependentiae bacterium]